MLITYRDFRMIHQNHPCGHHWKSLLQSGFDYRVHQCQPKQNSHKQRVNQLLDIQGEEGMTWPTRVPKQVIGFILDGPVPWVRANLAVVLGRCSAVSLHRN